MNKYISVFFVWGIIAILPGILIVSDKRQPHLFFLIYGTVMILGGSASMIKSLIEAKQLINFKKDKSIVNAKKLDREESSDNVQ